MTRDLERGRRRARRWMAWLAFAFLWTFALLSALALLYSDERKHIAEALAVAAAPLAAIVGPLTLILLGYLGMSGIEAAVRTWRNGKDP